MPLEAVSEAQEMVRMLDEQTVEVSLPSKIGYERIAMLALYQSASKI
jgi:hypothetical protein